MCAMVWSSLLSNVITSIFSSSQCIWLIWVVLFVLKKKKANKGLTFAIPFYSLMLCFPQHYIYTYRLQNPMFLKFLYQLHLSCSLFFSASNLSSAKNFHRWLLFLNADLSSKQRVLSVFWKLDSFEKSQNCQSWETLAYLYFRSL